MKLCILDADSLLYIVGWRMQQEGDEILLSTGIDAALSSIRTMVGTDNILICLDSGHKCFRYSHYRYAPYKGTRDEKPEYFQRLEPVFRKHLIENLKAQTVQGLETDDLVAIASRICREQGLLHVISSPDKDLKQIPGYHFDHNKMEKGVAEIQWVDQTEADARFWCQMLMGDTIDNVKGVPGLGPSKVKALFANLETVEQMRKEVKDQFTKYFGVYYGNIIFQETYLALKLIESKEEAVRVGSGINLDQLETFEKYVTEFAQKCSSSNSEYAFPSEPGEVVPAPAERATDELQPGSDGPGATGPALQSAMD